MKYILEVFLFYQILRNVKSCFSTFTQFSPFVLRNSNPKGILFLFPVQKLLSTTFPLHGSLILHFGFSEYVVFVFKIKLSLFSHKQFAKSIKIEKSISQHTTATASDAIISSGVITVRYEILINT